MKNDPRIARYPQPLPFLRRSEVRKFCNARGRKLGRDILPLIESHLRRKLDAACRVHNGGRTILCASAIAHVGLCPQ